MKDKIKIAVAAPEIKLCDPAYNATVCIESAKKANECGADVIVFPELTLTVMVKTLVFSSQIAISTTLSPSRIVIALTPRAVLPIGRTLSSLN